MVFLTSLCSSQPDVVARGMEGLGLLCEESALLLEHIDPTSDAVLYEYLDVSDSNINGNCIRLAIREADCRAECGK